MADRDDKFIAGLSEPERTFGAWLASKLDEDDWNKAEPMMLAALRQAREEGRKEQPITAETVRRVGQAIDSCGIRIEYVAHAMREGPLYDSTIEAIAQRANEVSHEG